MFIICGSPSTMDIPAPSFARASPGRGLPSSPKLYHGRELLNQRVTEHTHTHTSTHTHTHHAHTHIHARINRHRQTQTSGTRRAVRTTGNAQPHRETRPTRFSQSGKKPGFVSGMVNLVETLKNMASGMENLVFRVCVYVLAPPVPEIW